MKASPIQRQCPDCDGEEKLNGLTSGGGPKTKTDTSGDDKSGTNKTEGGNSDVPKDNGKSEGEIKVQQIDSPSPGSDQIAGPGENPLIQGLQQKKEGTPKVDQKQGNKGKKESEKDHNKKGSEKDKKIDEKSKEGQSEAGGKKEVSSNDRIEQAQAQLSAASSQATSLQGTHIFFKLPDNAQMSEEEKQKMQEQQFQTGYEASNALSSAASQVANLAGLASDMTQYIQAAQTQAQVSIQQAAEAQKAAIHQQSQQSIAQAMAKAATARSQVAAQHIASSTAIQTKYQTSKTSLETDYQKALEDLEGEKVAQMGRLDTVYSIGAKAYKETGRQAGERAIAEGKERMATYHKEMKYHPDGTEKRDSLAAGYLTNRKVKARKKAAKQVSESYRDSLVKAANEQVVEAMKGKSKDVESINAAIKTAQEQLKNHYDQTLKGIEDQKTQALEQANTTKTQLITGIDQNLNTVKASLTQQRDAQLQGIDKGTQTQIAQLGNQSTNTLATLLGLLGKVTSGLVKQLQAFQNFLNGAPLPNPTALQNLLALVNGKVSANIAETHETFQTRTQEAVGALQESGQAAGAGLQKVGDNAQKSFETTLNSYLKGTTNSTQAGVKSLQQIAQGHGQVSDQLQQSGKKGFEFLVKQTKDAFQNLNANLEKSFAAATDGLKKSLHEAIGEKESTNKKKMHGLIADKAKEAASKEQPAWKSIVKWILIIAVIVVVALVAGPAVIGAVGGFAATMGASAAAATVIGTVVGGAIVGAATSVTVQVINNWAAGDNLLKDVGKAAITGAIGGAFGAGAGLLIGKFASNVVIKFVLEAFADIVVDVTTKVAFGDISWEKLSNFDGETWKQIGMDALTSTAMSLGTNVLTSTKPGQNATKYFQNKGTNFGDKIGVKLGGTSKINVDTSANIKSPDTEASNPKLEESKIEHTAKTETNTNETSNPKVEAPKTENTTKTEVTKPKADPPKIAEPKVENTAKVETTKPKTDQPKVEEPKVEAKTEVETKTKDGRVPEGNVKGIKEEVKLSDKHEIKYTEKGNAYLCSPFCTDIKAFTEKYGDKIKNEQWISDRLNDIADLGDPVKIQKALEGLKTDIEHLNNYDFKDSGMLSTKGQVHKRMSKSGREIQEVQSENIKPAIPPADLPSSLDVSTIQHMQGSISNPTEDYFVLYNAKLVQEGQLSLPPIKVWKNLDPNAPGIWTLDHRRLAAYQLAGVKEIKVIWADPKEVIGDSFKMGTQTKGKDLTVWVPVSPDTGNFTKFSRDKSSYQKQAWTIKNAEDGTAKLFNDKGVEVKLDDVAGLLPDGYLKDKSDGNNTTGTTKAGKKDIDDMFDDLYNLSFMTQGQSIKPAWKHIDNGCNVRAHLLAQELKLRDIETKKIFAFHVGSSFEGKLEVHSKLAEDMPDNHVQSQPIQNWQWHVAVVIETGKYKGMVLDPALAGKPISIDEWMGKMGASNSQEVSKNDVQKIVTPDGNNYMETPPVYTIVDNAHFNPQDVWFDQKHLNPSKTIDNNIPKVKEFMDLEKYNIIAEKIRTSIEQGNTDVEHYIDIVKNLSSKDRVTLQQRYRNLLKYLEDHIYDDFEDFDEFLNE